jgi:hypothetical protein
MRAGGSPASSASARSSWLDELITNFVSSLRKWCSTVRGLMNSSARYHPSIRSDWNSAFPPMNVLLGFLVTAFVTAVAVAAMLFVRRRAPEGSRFTDGDRASGVFGVLATGFSVLLGFIIFLAFTSYDQSRTGAEDEALVVSQQVETAQFLPASVRSRLTGQLICYARSVVHGEWDRMEHGTQGDAINPWGVALFGTLQGVVPKTPSEQSAYDKWLEETSDREQARLNRIHGAVGVVPTSLWIVLFFISGVIFLYMLFFADSGESAITQGVLMGSVASVITILLLLLSALDMPFQTGIGGIRPVAMERTLRIVDQAIAATGTDVDIPCDGRGNRS